MIRKPKARADRSQTVQVRKADLAAAIDAVAEITVLLRTASEQLERLAASPAWPRGAPSATRNGVDGRLDKGNGRGPSAGSNNGT